MSADIGSTISPEPREPATEDVHSGKDTPTDIVGASTVRGQTSGRKPRNGVTGDKATGTVDADQKPDSRAAYQVGDLVLVKITGFPWWPAMVVTLDHLPEGAKRAQPTKGKKGASLTMPLPVQFLGAPEYYWPRVTDMKALTADEARTWLASGKKPSNKQLKLAYEAAVNPPSLQEMMRGKQKFAAADKDGDSADEGDDAVDVVDGEDAAGDGDAEEEAEDDDAAVDQESNTSGKMDADDEDDAASEGGRQKRKKTSTTPKSRAKAPRSAATPNKRRKAETAEDKETPNERPSAKKKARKSATARESPVGKATPSRPIVPEPTPEESAKDMWEKKKQTVMYLRHKLQKTLLSKDTVSEDNISPVPKFLQQLDDLEVEPVIFRETKIGKVLSRISKLEVIPRDDELNIRKHVNDLLSKWQKILGHGEQGNGSTGGVDASASNGVEESRSETKAHEAAESLPPNAQAT